MRSMSTLVGTPKNAVDNDEAFQVQCSIVRQNRLLGSCWTSWGWGGAPTIGLQFFLMSSVQSLVVRLPKALKWHTDMVSIRGCPMQGVWSCATPCHPGAGDQRPSHQSNSKLSHSIWERQQSPFSFRKNGSFQRQF